MRAAVFIATAAAGMAWAPARLAAAPDARIGQIRVCGDEARPRANRRRPAPGERLVLPPLEIVVEPLRYGPRVAEDPRDDGPLTAEGFRTLIPSDQLRACYRSARERLPELETTLSAVIRIDDWGGVASAEAKAESADARPVAACVQEVLAGMYAGRNVGRPTEVRMRIKLARSGLGRPHRERPKAGAPLSPPPGLCPAARAPLAELELGDPIVIDDFDEAQSAHEKQLACQRKVRREARACHPRHGELCGMRACAPSVVPGRFVQFSPALAELVPQRLRANVGAYRACYAEADTPPRGFGGTRDFEVSFERRGFVAAVTPIGAARTRHDRLEDCLAAALRNVWIEPVRPVQALVTIVLRPSPTQGSAPTLVPPPAGTPETAERSEARARATLEAGDGESARAIYQHLAATLPGDRRACDWLAGALAATEIAEPWLGERSMTAFGALAAHARAAPAAPETSACLKRAQKDLMRLVFAPHDAAEKLASPRLFALAAARYRRLLDELPGPPIPELRFYYAETLWSLERWCDAAAEYDEVSTRKQDSRFLADAQYTAPLAWENCLGATDRRDSAAAELIRRHLKESFDRYAAAQPAPPPNPFRR